MKEEKTKPLFYVGIISQLLLVPLVVVAWCYSWDRGFDMSDAGIYLPQPLRMAIGLLPLIAIILLIAWAVLKKEHAVLQVLSTVVAVGIIFSIISAEVMYAHPEEFDLYSGRHYFVTTTPEEIIENGDSKTPALVFIDDGESGTCSFVSNLVGKNHLTVNYFNAADASEAETEALDECMDKFGISSLPAVFIASGGRTLYLFEGDTLEESLREYFDIMYPEQNNFY